MTSQRQHRRQSNAVARQWIALLVVLSFTPHSVATTPPSAPLAGQGVLEVFVRDGCPHCADAKAFLPEFASRRPGLRIAYRAVDQDPLARDELVRYTRSAGVWPPGVPTFVFDGRVLIGFKDPQRTGAELAALIDQRADHAEQIDTGLFGALSVARLGLPLFTLAVGLLDGFNPCAMWVLLFLLSLLVHLRDRMRMAAIAGTFVLVSGAVYYLFMAAWLNVFLIVGISAALRVALGVLAIGIGAVNVKDAWAPARGFSLSIPAAAKPGLYARMRAIVRAESLLFSLLAAAGLAIAVNFVELLCTAGFPALYTAILTQHELSPATHYAYLGLYILGYIADDALMVGVAVAALSSTRLTENAGRWLKLLSGAVMLILGIVMIVRPQWLL
jgi:glutaredoxin